MRGFERACPSQAGDEGTTTVECDNWADGPRAGGPQADRVRAGGPLADGPQADGVWAGGPQADGPWAGGPLADGPRADRAMQLQMEEDQQDNPPTD